MKKGNFKHLMLAFSVKAVLNAADKQKFVVHAAGSGALAVTDKVVTDTQAYPIGSTLWDMDKNTVYKRIATNKAVADWEAQPKVAYVATAPDADDAVTTDTIAYPKGSIIIDTVARIVYFRIAVGGVVGDFIKTAALTAHT